MSDLNMPLFSLKILTTYKHSYIKKALYHTVFIKYI